MTIKLPKPETSVLEAARLYLENGWQPFPLRPRDKKAAGKWKEVKSWTKASLVKSFPPSANISLRTGPVSGNLIDLDFDWPEAAQVGAKLFYMLPAFGRKSSAASHRMVRTVLKKTRIPFELPNSWTRGIDSNGSMVFELRGDKHLTMVPPSIHPSGERVEWESGNKEVPELPANELVVRAGLCAFLAVIVRYYPRQSGNRDEVCLALTGTLIRTELSDVDIDQCVALVAQLSEDEEAQNRVGKSEASRTKAKAGENVWGLPELCRKLEISELEPTLRKWLGLEGDYNDGRPQIVIKPGDRPRMVDEAEQALIKADVGVFQRYDELVRVVRLETPTSESGVGRPTGALLIRSAPAAWLTEQFALVARWVHPTEEGYRLSDPRSSLAAAYRARLGSWRVRPLSGVTATPTLRFDGSLLTIPGYDAATQIYYDPGTAQFPEVPEEPTEDQARAALAVLAKPFRDFVFADDASRSVAIAAVLTALVRPMFPSAPLFAIDAPTAGTGKSLLAETIGIIASGHRPAMMSQGANLEEDQKRLGSVLMTGDRVLVIDNCDKPIEGDFLCSMLTQSEVQVRILGKSEIVRLPTRCTVIATGNNLVISGDMSRRVLRCRLDAQVERPDQLQYDFDPREEALVNRPEIVSAGLTVLRAYIAAGKPPQTDRIGSFDHWNMVRDALVWLGEDDPETTRLDILADDPSKNTLVELLVVWEEALGDIWVTIADLPKLPHSKAKVALVCELNGATRQHEFNPRSVGRFLAKHVDRIAGGRVLRAEAGPGSVKRYRVEQLRKPDESPTDGDLPF